MPDQVPLFVLPATHASEASSTSLLSSLRDTSFIAEVSSGAAEESGLWHLLRPASAPTGMDAAEPDLEALARYAVTTLNPTGASDEWNTHALVVADARTFRDDADGSLVVVQVNGRRKVDDGEAYVADSMRVARNSLLEASNLAAVNMDLVEYRDMCGNAEVYDARYGPLRT